MYLSPIILYFLCSDEKARGDHNESVLASYLETSTTSEVEQPQICKLIFFMNIPCFYSVYVTVKVQNTGKT